MTGSMTDTSEAAWKQKQGENYKRKRQEKTTELVQTDSAAVTSTTLHRQRQRGGVVLLQSDTVDLLPNDNRWLN